MNTLRKAIQPDWETAERLYPLVLRRLKEYEVFWDAQSEETPEEVFNTEYKKMEQELSQFTGKDLSDVWLWEWWEDNGIEVLAFDVALPAPKKHTDLTKADLLALVHIICTQDFESESDFQEEFKPFMFYQHQYFHQFLEINFKKTYKPNYFYREQDKNGKWYQLSEEEIIEKMWK
ncbi:hypothetical protein A4G20_07385 [Pasteurellaceae bacterium RH1A]|nr:hypothetical protein A4G20_07385 [Pasteurellaceae bacterium RH1A]